MNPVSTRSIRDGARYHPGGIGRGKCFPRRLSGAPDKTGAAGEKCPSRPAFATVRRITTAGLAGWLWLTCLGTLTHSEVAWAQVEFVDPAMGVQGQSIRLNGKPLTQVWFRHADVINGGTLDLQMGNTPNLGLGSDPADVPPSAMSVNPASFE
jgi:hypothetical protein